MGVRAPSVCDRGDVQADLFVRFAQRRLFDTLARFDHASGQRDLPAVPLERVGANGEDEVRDIVDRKKQEEAGGVADGCRRDARRPLAHRAGRQTPLRVGSRQGSLQRRFERASREDVTQHVPRSTV